MYVGSERTEDTTCTFLTYIHRIFMGAGSVEISFISSKVIYGFLMMMMRR